MNRFLLQSPQWVPASLFAAVVIITAVLWLYRLQSRILRWPWTWIVPTLRLAAVCSLLASVARPIVLRARSANEQGAVVVLVDRSRSMSVSDAHRTPAQRVAIADALGEVPEGKRSAVFAEMRTRADELSNAITSALAVKSEFDYAQLSGRGTSGAAARLATAVDGLHKSLSTLASLAATAPRSAPILTACNGLSDALDPAQLSSPQWGQRLRPRLEALVRAVADAQAAADAELFSADPEIQDVADQIDGMSRIEFVERALTDPQVGLFHCLPPNTDVLTFGAEPDLPELALNDFATPVLTADGDRSDLSGALAAVRTKLRSRPIQAVILLSDGRQIGGSGGAAPYLGVPVITVGVGETVANDVAITQLILPPVVFAGETGTARVEVLSKGQREQAADLKITGPGEPIVQHVTLTDGRHWFSFPLRFPKPGVENVSASIVGSKPESSNTNNRSDRRVKVLAQRVEVAVIGGSASWDYQYLRNALQRSPWITCHDELVGSGSNLKMTPDEILHEQEIVLLDVNPTALSHEQWVAINKLVTERGGGVIVAAGPDVSPAQLAAEPLFAELLPWKPTDLPAWKTWQGETPGYHLIPQEGSSDTVRLTGDPTEDRRRWSELSGVYRILPIDPTKPNVHPLLMDRDSKATVLTEARVGAGRALFLGTAETWRWRYKIGERDQDRFWLQLIRRAGEAPYTATNSTYALDLDRVRITPDDTVRVRAKVLDAQGKPAVGVHPTVRLVRGNATVLELPLGAAVPDVETGRYNAVLPAQAKGDYQVQLLVGDATPKLAVPLQVESNYEAEMADQSGDDGNLRRLAEASGGEFLRLDQVRTLPVRLEALRQKRPQSIEYPLWDSPYLFLFVLGCLGGEWALRKRFGLV